MIAFISAITGLGLIITGYHFGQSGPLWLGYTVIIVGIIAQIMLTYEDRKSRRRSKYGRKRVRKYYYKY